MNKIISKKEIINEVCIVLEKERNSDSVVFTSARGILRKIKREDLNVKDIAMALDYLEAEGKIQIVTKSNRQTVLKVKDNLFEINLDEVVEGYEEEKELILSITPKRLLGVLKEKSIDGSAEISCREVRGIFSCTFSQVKATVRLIQKNHGIDVSFEKGIIKADLNENKILTNNSEIDLDDSECDAIFNQIGEGLEGIFKELERLRSENKELENKLVRTEVSNKRLREEVTELSAKCDSLRDRNNRLYNKLVDATNNRN